MALQIGTLPPKSLLMEKLLDLRYKYDLELVTAAFTDLRDCPSTFQESFMNAMKAIECGNLPKMMDSMHKMKELAQASTNHDDYLDIYCLQSVVSKRKGKRTLYYMTLLAYSAIHNQRGMMECLINEGASLHLGNSMIGSPLSQVLVYLQHFDCPNKVESSILERLLDGAISDDLNVNILHSFAVGSGQMVCICSPLELAILIQRIDVVKLMVKAGANPILADSDPNEASGVVHLLSEYYEFGTNHYISWLLQEHLLSHEISKFIEKVFEVNIFNDDAMEMFTEVGRHPAHALLTCGHKEMISRLIEVHGQSMLTVKDAHGKTALQIAAGQGDLESVRILLNIRKGSCDKSDMAKALMVAAQGDHVKVVEYLLQMETTLIVEKVSNGKELWKEAVTEKLSCVFEVLRDLDQTVMVGRIDDNGNTLGHIAALTGNSKLFKVVFPLTSLKLAESEQAEPHIIPLDENAHQKIQKGQFAALMWENHDGKTPLHLAIENNHTFIMRTLKERVNERESKPCAEQNMEKLAWDSFWVEWGPKLLLYACSYGSVDTVKLLVKDMACLPNYQLCSGGETPLSCAARAGKDDTVMFLLSLNTVSIPKSPEHSPLILAATNGYTRSVQILLKKGADVNERNPEGFNCLMKAIERKQRDTVLAILSDAKQGLKALQFCNGSVTPFRMLIKQMPDVAEWVLNKCVLPGIHTNTLPNNSLSTPVVQGEGTDLGEDKPENNKDAELIHKEVTPKGYTLENKFELLEDFQSYESVPLRLQSDTEMVEFSLVVESSPGDEVTDSPSEGINTSHTKWGPKEYQTSNHPLKLMVDYDREKLLSHPLVKELLSYKWKRVGIPGLVVYFSCYLMFLIFLTAFALVIPRPGPRNIFCPATVSNEVDNGTMNFTDSMVCQDSWFVNEITNGFLHFAAIVLMLIAIVYLVFEVFQMIRRRTQYLTDYENYIQVTLFICSFVFVVPTGDKCWCTPAWKWQFGIIAVFLGWLNCIILLRNWPVWGRPAAMLLNVYLNFVKLVYLPILLILTFGFPFYMIFVEIGSHEDFVTPASSLWKVVLQTSGDIDAGTIFSEPNIVYPVVGYALFIIFIIAMPILFNNFLIGMAVGETEEERRKARLASVKTKVNYIFEIEDSIPYLRKFSFMDATVRPPTHTTLDDVTEKEFQDRNNVVIEEIKAKNCTKQMSMHMRKLTHDMTLTQDALSNLNNSVIVNQKQTMKLVDSLREDIEQFKRQNKEVLSAYQEGMVKNAETTIDTLHKSIATLKADMETVKAMILQSTSDLGHSQGR